MVKQLFIVYKVEGWDHMKPIKTFDSFEEAVKFIHEYLKRAQTDLYMDRYARLGIAQQFKWQQPQYYSSSTEITIQDTI